MLLDVGDKVEEAARDVNWKLELTRSVDERDFKIDHDTDGPVDDRRAVFNSDLLHQSKEALVDGWGGGEKKHTISLL